MSALETSSIQATPCAESSVFSSSRRRRSRGRITRSGGAAPSEIVDSSRRPESPAAPAPRSRRRRSVSATSVFWWPVAMASRCRASRARRKKARRALRAAISSETPGDAATGGSARSVWKGRPSEAAKSRTKAVSAAEFSPAMAWSKQRTKSEMRRARQRGRRWRTSAMESEPPETAAPSREMPSRREGAVIPRRRQRC